MQLIQQFYSRLHQIYMLRSSADILSWDEQVTMPPGAGAFRGEQISYLSSNSHALLVDQRFEEVVQKLSTVKELSLEDSLNVREVLKSICKKKALSSDLVQRKARLSSECFQIWQQAKQDNNFAAVAPKLSEIIEVTREEAHAYTGFACPYDGLLDEYEPGATISSIEGPFQRIAKEISNLLPNAQKKLPPSPLIPLKVQHQAQLGASIAKALGFDFSRGRLDPSAHPFSTHLGKGDFRITTRYEENTFLSALTSVIHEVGHSLYEMGLREEYIGTPLGTASGLGTHESQSRFWENIVGRSAEFSRFLERHMHKVLGESAPKVNAQQLFAGLNSVQPSLVRIEADELTYSLHIVIRTMLEIALFSNKLRAKDIPDAWSDMYQQYLGIRPSTDKEGCMQDIHWYSGMFGYFPTYLLGNLYGAIFTEVMQKELTNYSMLVEEGNFSPILSWLKKNVHQHGMSYNGAELCQKLSGKAPTEEAFLSYLKLKFS